MFLICAVSAVASWWMFTRLEVLEGHSHIQIPDLLRRRCRGGRGDEDAAPSDRDRSSGKICGCSRWRSWSLLSTSFRGRRSRGWTAGRSMSRWASCIPLTLLYGGSLAILIGSLASAEERQLGMLEWQTLLPSPAWQQWAVKVGVTFGLALLLGVSTARPAPQSPPNHGLPGTADVAPGRTDLRAADGHQPIPVDALQESGRRHGRVVSHDRRDVRFGTAHSRRAVPRPARTRPTIQRRSVLRVAAAIGDGCGTRRAPRLARVPQSPDGGAQRGASSEAGTRHRRLPGRLRAAPHCPRAAAGALRRPLSAAPRRRRSHAPPPARPCR